MSFLLLTAAALVSGVVGGEMRIKSVDDFIDFSKTVNNGVSYSGTTVFLDSELSFAGETFEPIGYYISDNNCKYFSGVFDGQGHVVSNLHMNSSSQYVGLFGYSRGLTIRNVILDSSCSITSSFSNSYHTYVGGSIGYCRASNGPCTIENSVNMGSVSFSGDISGNYYLYLGGIAGCLSSSSKYEITVMNCVNYGDVTHSGTSFYSYIGGLIGESDGSSSNRMYIYNSLNHGTITHNGTTSYSLYLGGITGRAYYTAIENCVSGGKISLLTRASNYNYVGSIIGYAYSSTIINYCYYTNDLGGYIRNSGSISYDSTTFELDGTVSIGNYTDNSLIGALNAAADYYTLREYSRWLFNKDNKDVSFTFNGEQTLTLNSQIILLPSLASEGNISFDGWYKDSEHTSPLTETVVMSNTELYGRFEENTNNYTITFDTRGGSSIPSITASFNSIVTLPSDLTRDQCNFMWWENVYGDKMEFNFTISGHSITLYVVWKCTRIETPDDFIGFSKVVNSGTNYEGTTVFLDSDIDLTGKTFEPIGTYSNYFRGVFDGQGHVISNLNMNSSSSQYVGLFGYSRGLTIKNVILYSSCSIASTFSNFYHTCLGGIIGECEAENGPCTIENSVNMGSVSFSGNISRYSLYLGGITGSLDFYSSSNHDSTVKNCANYGDVTRSGESDDSFIGGLIGESDGSSSSNRVYIYNCLNHGTITHKGTTSSLYVGGIVGRTDYTTFENCVSGGKISSSKAGYIGSIIGYAYSDTSINYCYWTSDLSGYSRYGYSFSSSESNTLSYDTSFELNGTVFIESYAGKSLIDALNAYSNYYTFRDYSNWLLNKDNKDVSFTINGRTSPIKVNSQIILLPSLASEGNMSFDGWYEDSGLTTLLTSYEIMSDTELYGMFEENTNNYTITFDTRREGVFVAPITAPFNSVVTLPSGLIDGKYSIGFWETLYGDKIEFIFTMQAHNITLYAVWKCTRIETPEDFIDFSNTMNNGAHYYDVTMFLDSDIDLSRKTFELIGNSESHYFSGVFDGQGHVISNLKMISSSQYVGLFGYSEGLTIKNVILDSSCSITNTYDDYQEDVYAGGIIGRCSAENKPCVIENSVNMGSVSFSGYTNDGLYLGGIIGGLYSSSNYESTVKNCANYGDVTHTGYSGYSNIGGIIGYSDGSSDKRVSIYNSLNHGTITHKGTTSYELYLGGIAGETRYTTIENCVSAGKISLLTTKSYYNHIGSIAGEVYGDTSINHCYYTSELSGYTKRIGSFSYDNTTFELDGTVSIGNYTGNTLIGALNAYTDNYTLREYSHWLLNKDNKDVSFTINERTNSIKMDYQIILMPSLASEGNMNFDGWYMDKELTNPFTETEISERTKLYGKYCGPNYTVTFDVNGGDELVVKEMTICCERVYGDLPIPMRTEATFVGWFTGRTGGTYTTAEGIMKLTKNTTLYAHWNINQYNLTIIFNNGSENEVRTLDFNEEIDYPENVEKTGYTFNGWDNKPDRMPTENITITALWTANKYTVTFDVNGGNALSESESKKNVTYDSTYGDLPEATRTGYTLDGWFTEKNESITEETIVAISGNHTLHAHWLEVSSQVEIVFSKKDMTREEIENVVKKYTNADFEIVEVENGNDEMKVIIKFIDAEGAKHFVQDVNNASKTGKESSLIKRVDFIRVDISFSPEYHPISLLLYLI